MGSCGADAGVVNSEPAHDRHFPMYVVKVSDFLKMEGAPMPHRALEQQGLLYEWCPGMFVIFVSHQWLGATHPDPRGEQLAVLRQSLTGIIEGSLHVEGDMISLIKGRPTLQLPDAIRKEIQHGFLFLDWFAIPQITARHEGVNEAVTRSNAALAVQSIPAYVEASNVFVALVPELPHVTRGTRCNYPSWLSRGWCRAELYCHLLSNKPDTSVIVIHSAMEAEYMFPLDWQHNTVAEGDFTVESDRAIVVKLSEMAVDSKIRHLAAKGPTGLYRFYVAYRAKLLGRPCLPWDLVGFLENFRFPSFQDAISDKIMNGALCAAIAGDAQMLSRLIQRRDDVNYRVSGLSDLGFYDSQTLLMVAAKSHQSAEVLSTLLELRADVNARDLSGLNSAFYARSAQQVKVLVEAKADIHSICSPLGLAPLTGAASSADAGTVAALLEAMCDPNPEPSGAGYGPLHGVAGFARQSNRFSASKARLLLASRADINMRARPTGKFRLITLAARAHTGLLGFGSGSISARRVAALPGITPLGTAAMLGDGELAQLFLEFGAQVLENDRGDTPTTCLNR